MSGEGELSFEQISLSSNDSWALLDVEEDGTEANVDTCVLDESDTDRCYVCDKPLLESRFSCPFCDQCFICAVCKEAYTLQPIPPCSHSLPPGCAVPMFCFDDSAGEDILVMNPVCHATPEKDSSESRSNSIDADYSSQQSDNQHIIGDKGLQTSESKSLADHVREALNLSTTHDEDVRPDCSAEPQITIRAGTNPMDSVPFKHMVSPKLWHQPDSTGSTASSGSGISSTAVSAAAAALRPSVQLVLGSCNSSECRTSPTSSTCSRSPPSLSSSPMNVASRIFKSVAMHSAAAMNNFDCMPMDGFDTPPVVKKHPPKRPSAHSQPTTPPSSVHTTAVEERNDFVSRFMWDNEKVHSLVKPKPIPKSVIEQSAYNLR